MERDLAPIVEILDESNKNTSDHDPSFPWGGKISTNIVQRVSIVGGGFCAPLSMPGPILQRVH